MKSQEQLVVLGIDRIPSADPENNLLTSQVIVFNASPVRGTNYRVMSTVWNPDRLLTESADNFQYISSQSLLDQQIPPSAFIQSFAALCF